MASGELAARIEALEKENQVFRQNQNEDTPGPWIQRAFDALAMAQGNAEKLEKLAEVARRLLPEVIDADLPSVIRSTDSFRASLERIEAIGARWQALRDLLEKT